ncbi:WD40/YVTN/BNR-like repeat-containing protein [Cognatiluteimonas lumbrici]|uniref:WD40/YVTN/BNR-like repeat-containing protein n=1 Tax=Cognatiluteimonas lumbrici TaxID=2559601 RepID=UPI001127E616|nr:oxidoreductase [Luteimonas lumbrici]
MRRWRAVPAVVLALAAGTAAAQATLVPQDSGVNVRLRGISAVDANVAWASGREGTVLRTVDGGAHWQALRVPGAEALDFRDVEGFDANTAVVLSIGPGASSRVYRTVDGGATWTLALRNDDARAFFDCMAFDGDRGWLLGDPVDGHFQVYTSEDAGRTWHPAEPAPGRRALPDEAAYAASGTCIAVTPWGERMVVTGGGAARVLLGDSGGELWFAYDAPMPARVPATGIFSATPVGEDMLLVGGDFEHEETGSAALAQFVSGEGLSLSPLPDPNGYRSGAACLDGRSPQCIAVGPNGVDLLREGRWQALSATGYDSVDIAGDVGWASGDQGRIARIELTPR